MACDHAVGFAVRTCPFLKAVAAKEGGDFAANFAVAPLRPASSSSSRRLLDEPSAFESFAASFEFFHGESGVVPLRTRHEGAQNSSSSSGRCPYAATAAATAAAVAATTDAASPPSSTPILSPAPAPFASISLPLFGGGMPDGGEWIRRMRRQRQQQQQQRQQQQQKKTPGSSSSPSSSSTSKPPPSASGCGGGGGVRTGGGNRGPSPPGVASRGTSSSTSIRPPLPPRRNPPPSRRRRKDDGGDQKPSSPSSSSEPRCPLRDWPVLGALLPLAAGGETLGLNCPAAVVALRAAVARVPQVRQLRPRPLWLKGAAVVAAGAAANAPFGAWREHTRKFSVEWFVAVHATVPFVAALRQATLLPRWALVLTVAGAVAGQMIGARVERARLRGLERRKREEEQAARNKKKKSSSSASSPAPTFPALLPPLLRSGGRGLDSLDHPSRHQQQQSSSIVVV